MTLDDIKRFRQLDSQLPRPSRVPLDRRASRRRPARSARASRPASAWRSPSAGWPRTSTGPASTLFDYDVYAIAGDGCMMEGISGEAASLAGHLKLANLCWIYDNNQHHHRGPHRAARSATTSATRFIGYGWNVTRVGDANDLEMLDRAFDTFKNDDRSPDADHRRQPHRRGARRTSRTRTPRTASRSARSEIQLTKRCYGWPEDAKFLVPDGVREHFDRRHRRARRGAARAWMALVRRVPRRSIRDAGRPAIYRMQRRELPDRLGQEPPDLPDRRRRAWPAATPPAKVLNARRARTCRG